LANNRAVAKGDRDLSKLMVCCANLDRHQNLNPIAFEDGISIDSKLFSLFLKECRFMNIKHLVLASILSLGTITGCSTETKTPEANVKVNPSAVNTIPSPAMAQKAPVGGLAVELQGKPVVVDIYASWCPACKNVASTLAKLKKEYAGKANFVVLDVSDKSTTAKATARAKELGLDKFLAKNLSQTGLIAVFDPATGKVLAEERDEPEIATYKKPLDVFIAKAK
jgi:thiol-disulfide isomerase/thioredoxin